ncbi:MAG: hypothetical protein GY856_05080, partial [bacterium]|nr:hypothetical protein [bacterium]
QPPLVTDALFVLLQRESRDCIRDHPRRSLELAELALVAVEVMDRTLISCAKDVESDAWACLANARRTACDLRGADEALTTAYGFYREGSRTTLRLAKLLDYEGSLRRDQRRFDHALVCLDRALEIYRKMPWESRRAVRIDVDPDAARGPLTDELVPHGASLLSGACRSGLHGRPFPPRSKLAPYVRMRKNSLSEPEPDEQRQVLELGIRKWWIRKALEEYQRGPYFCELERPRSCWERRLPAGP